VALRFLSRPGVAIYDMHENMAASIKHKPWIPSWLRSTVAHIWTRLEFVLLRGVPVIFAEYSYQRDYPWVRCSEVVLNMPKSEQLVALQAGTRVEGKLIYVGGVAEGRGSLMTLRALEVLQRKKREVEFLCIGPASQQHRVELEAFVSQKNLKNVRFIGRMRSAEAWRLASECHIGLATVLPLPNYIESYPTKLFEYMAVGLPVIASNFPLYKDIVETTGCGICVDPEDPEQIANAITTLLDNPRLATDMGKRGQNAALHRFRWEMEANKLRAFYSRVLSPLTAVDSEGQLG
jgi:glycosyltransferase involved in cell wall biosynthesis